MKAPKVILASASPRRQQFFQSLGIPFLPESADVDETPAVNESPAALVERLAIAKALTVGNRRNATLTDETNRDDQGDFLVVGADTVVALAGEILGKPAHIEEAYAMLVKLRAGPHKVHTALAIALFANAKLVRSRTLVNTTTVNMRCYRDSEVAAYIATGDPMDKAGAYAIQHQQFNPVASFSGCPAAVMGLPVADLVHLLSEFGLHVGPSPWQVCSTLTGFPCCQERPPATQVHFDGVAPENNVDGVLPN